MKWLLSAHALHDGQMCWGKGKRGCGCGVGKCGCDVGNCGAVIVVLVIVVVVLAIVVVRSVLWNELLFVGTSVARDGPGGRDPYSSAGHTATRTHVPTATPTVANFCRTFPGDIGAAAVAFSSPTGNGAFFCRGSAAPKTVATHVDSAVSPPPR